MPRRRPMRPRPIIPFVSVAALPELFAEYNNDKARHVCAKCGHVNREFPVAAWGWDKYADQSAAAMHRAASSDRGIARRHNSRRDHA